MALLRLRLPFTRHTPPISLRNPPAHVAEIHRAHSCRGGVILGGCAAHVVGGIQDERQRAISMCDLGYAIEHRLPTNITGA
jgi:hypothetical protein